MIRRSCELRWAMLVGVGAILVAPDARAEDWTFSDKLLPSTGSFGDQIGQSVAISSDSQFAVRAIVGAPGDDLAGDNSGSASICRPGSQGWVEEALLSPPDLAADDQFGYGVAIWRDLAVVGAVGDDDAANNGGSAYVYFWHNGAWTLEQKLLVADAAGGDRLGLAVSIWDGSICLANRKGVAYVFGFDGTSWVQEDRLDGPGDSQSVSMFGDTIVVGAPQDSQAGAQAGAAYVFRFNGSRWLPEQTITASDAADADWFGESVAVFDDVILVGAAFDDDNGNGSGAAYVYRYDGATWREEQKLTAADARGQDQFGSSVALFGDVAMIGAEYDDLPDYLADAGSVYMFRFDGAASWVQQSRITAPDSYLGDRFGSAVGMSENQIVIAAVREDGMGLDSGSAYVFEATDAQAGCVFDMNDNGVVNLDDVNLLLMNFGCSGGCTGDVDGDGDTDLDDLTAMLTVYGLDCSQI